MREWTQERTAMAHSYPFSIRWTGTTADPSYSTDATAVAAGKSTIPVSSAPEFRGNPARWNPEDLLGAALSTCHMLTFLALCAKARVEVKDYEDRAESVLDTVGKVTCVTEVQLRPVIRVAPGTSMAKVVELFEKAHKYCFVANSVKCRVVLAPRVVEA
jgi:organic hydroperoxide reductase OsmC/OhrA